MKLKLTINWEGPYSLSDVILKMIDGGRPPHYDGEDYGIYQIYGRHILNGDDTLLYVGKATNQRFSTRFKQHKRWLINEEKIRIYLGRTYHPKRHDKDDNWDTWKRDMELAEKLIINKYSPNYNSRSISQPPKLGKYQRIELNHIGRKKQLHKKDVAPDDWI